MVSIPFQPPLSSHFSGELFHQTYLSSSHEEIEEALPLILLADYCIGTMRISYLVIEVKRIQSLIEEGKTLKNSVELRYQSLSMLANSLEILLWLQDRNWVELSKSRGRKVQGISYLSRMILYERAVRKEGATFIRIQRYLGEDPDLADKREYKYLKMSLISHTAFLGWATMHFISLTGGTPFPRPFKKLLHISSFAFGLIAMGYSKNSEFKEIYQKIKHLFPNGEIY